jgi:hypothetical protein
MAGLVYGGLCYVLFLLTFHWCPNIRFCTDANILNEKKKQRF